MTLLFPERFTPLNWIQSPCCQPPTPPFQIFKLLEWALHCQELSVTAPPPPLDEELLELLLLLLLLLELLLLLLLPPVPMVMVPVLAAPAVSTI